MVNVEPSTDAMIGTSVDRTPPEPRARVVALYLPQYHPTPENSEWWGPGFTEWTNVAKARPLYRGHVQPNIPGELGFYDLRLAETREDQADLARRHGIEGFCYWNYWFAGRRLLHRPFDEVLASGSPDFPFCVGWANHSWTGVWIGAPEKALVDQTYPGAADARAFFECFLPAFRDRRYIRVGGKPVLVLFRPRDISNRNQYLSIWRSMALNAGLSGLHIVGVGATDVEPSDLGLDAVVSNWVPERRLALWRRAVGKLVPALKGVLQVPTVYSYSWFCERALGESIGPRMGGWEHPFLMPNWDNTPRAGKRGVVLHGSSPELFRRQVTRVISALQAREVPAEFRLVFLKSWNEWAEGNYIEPDRRWGRAYLEVLRDELFGDQTVQTGRSRYKDLGTPRGKVAD
jgi:hypothetical protein